MKKYPTGEKLKALAKEYGIPTEGGQEDNFLDLSDAELQRRLVDFYRQRRDEWLPLISAIAIGAVLSAAIALYAVLVL